MRHNIKQDVVGELHDDGQDPPDRAARVQPLQGEAAPRHRLYQQPGHRAHRLPPGADVFSLLLRRRGLHQSGRREAASQLLQWKGRKQCDNKSGSQAADSAICERYGSLFLIFTISVDYGSLTLTGQLRI